MSVIDGVKGAVAGVAGVVTAGVAGASDAVTMKAINSALDVMEYAAKAALSRDAMSSVTVQADVSLPIGGVSISVTFTEPPEGNALRDAVLAELGVDDE